MCYNITIKLDVVQHRILSYAARVRRHRKDWDNITTAPKEKFTHTPAQLKNLVQAAQRGEQEAIDKLCHDFAPLIYKEAKGSNVQNALGEDAVNTAWVIFLEFIQRYKGNNFRLLPGLVRKHVHYGLLHSIAKCRHLTKEQPLEDEQLTLCYSPIDEASSRLSLTQAVKQLSDKERLVMQYCYEGNASQKAAAAKLGCSERSVRRYHSQALSKLKKHLPD